MGRGATSTLAGFALTSGDVEGAAPLLAAAWSGCDPAADPELAALIAHRNAFHALVNLRDDAVVAWTERAEGLSPDALLGVEWIAMHALALWRLGRRSEAYALLESAAGAGRRRGRPAARQARLAALRRRRSWAAAARIWRRPLRRSCASVRLSIGAIHLTTLARAHYAAGAWEDAVVAAERAVAISSELEHAPGRAFVWWGAVAVPAARGDWEAADAYAARGAAEPIDAPDRVVAAGMAQALPAIARGDAAAVIRVLEPIARLSGLARPARPSASYAPRVLAVAGPLRRCARRHRARRRRGPLPRSPRGAGGRDRARLDGCAARAGARAGRGGGTGTRTRRGAAFERALGR